MFLTILILTEHFHAKGRKITVGGLFLPYFTLTVVLTGGIATLSRSACGLRIFKYDNIRELEMASDRYVNNRTTDLGRLLYSAYVNTLSKKDLVLLEQSLESIQVRSCSFRSPNIIFVIGEAFNKHHSSLYGYPLPTNPLLQKRRESGNLYTFSDVVTPINLTSAAIQGALSFANQDNRLYWAKTPLFPGILKKAGYKTLFLDNQTKRKGESSIFQFGLQRFLYNARISPLLFSATNSTNHPFDLELVGDYLEIDRQTPSDKNLVIFHLLGQHIIYSERFPAEFAKFTIRDLPANEFLHNDTDRQIAVNYDNATLYNDFVIDSIIRCFVDKDAILIYMPDHGEEVFDYRTFFSRSHESRLTPGMCRYQFQIPFMIWVSDKYKTNHPDLVARIRRSADRPFMTDDIPHLILDLAGIDCEWYEASRSLIDDRYDTGRKRLLRENREDYDALLPNEYH